MKTLIKTPLSVFLVLITVCSFLFAASSIAVDYNGDKSLARVNKKSDKYIFTHCEPVQSYEVVFTDQIKSVLSSNQINSVEKIEDMLLKRAFKEAEKMNKEFDAIIIQDDLRSSIIKFKE